jgi:hypothetical protein
LAFAGFPSKALGVVPMAHGDAAAMFAAGGFGAGGGFPPGGGSGACWIGTCTGAKEGGVELLCTSGVDKSAAVNEGLAISPVDGCLCFPFLVVVGKEPGSADAGLVCPKTEPVCGVWGRLDRLRDSFCVAVTMVCSVISSNSLT